LDVEYLLKKFHFALFSRHTTIPKCPQYQRLTMAPYRFPGPSDHHKPGPTHRTQPYRNNRGHPPQNPTRQCSGLFSASRKISRDSGCDRAGLFPDGTGMNREKFGRVPVVAENFPGQSLPAPVYTRATTRER